MHYLKNSALFALLIFSYTTSGFSAMNNRKHHGQQHPSRVLRRTRGGVIFTPFQFVIHNFFANRITFEELLHRISVLIIEEGKSLDTTNVEGTSGWNTIHAAKEQFGDQYQTLLDTINNAIRIRISRALER